jgi:hypothetical protein
MIWPPGGSAFFGQPAFGLSGIFDAADAILFAARNPHALGWAEHPRSRTAENLAEHSSCRRAEDGVGKRARAGEMFLHSRQCTFWRLCSRRWSASSPNGGDRKTWPFGQSARLRLRLVRKDRGICSRWAFCERSRKSGASFRLARKTRRRCSPPRSPSAAGNSVGPAALSSQWPRQFAKN